MSCERTTERLSDRLAGALSHDDERRLAEHLATCPACREEADAIAALWTDLGAIEEDVPHERMRARFHATLAAYERRGGGALGGRLERLWPQRPAFQLGLTAAALLLGLVGGMLLPTARDSEIAGLREDLRAVGVVLLGHQSAAERLRGVEWTARLGGNGDSRPLAALIETMQRDPNLNVRLAAVDALQARTDRTEVAAALTAALGSQDAPLMQVTLARVLLERRVDGSIPAIRRLLEREGLDPAVREFLRTALEESGELRPADSEV